MGATRTLRAPLIQWRESLRSLTPENICRTEAPPRPKDLASPNLGEANHHSNVEMQHRCVSKFGACDELYLYPGASAAVSHRYEGYSSRITFTTSGFEVPVFHRVRESIDHAGLSLRLHQQPISRLQVGSTQIERRLSSLDFAKLYEPLPVGRVEDQEPIYGVSVSLEIPRQQRS